MDDTSTLEAVIGLILFLLFTVFPLVLFYFTGSYIEKRHYQDIILREKKFINKPIITFGKKYKPDDQKIEWARLSIGSVVIGQDYFKQFLASLYNLVGGRITCYETLLDRARREAVLRMIEKEPRADIIMNLRVQTSTIGFSANKKKNAGAVEILAYGTAVKYKS